MKKWIIIALFAVIIALSGCAQKPADKVQNPESASKAETAQSTDTKSSNSKLKVALDATYKPMEWEENGNITGFDTDLIKAVGKELGKDIELTKVAWDEIFDKLVTGDFDLIISSVSITDERKKIMLFSEPYFDSTYIIITRTTSGIKSSSDLSGKTVALQDGITAMDVLDKNVPGVKFKKFSSGDDVLKSLENKEVDAVVLDEPVALDFVKQKNNPEYITLKDQKLFQSDHFGIAANKKDEQLVNDINKALAKLKANGEYQKIFDKYFKN